MLQANKQQTVKVDVNVNTDKVQNFINDLVNLLNKYGLDGISICNETKIEINLLDLMEYRVTPTLTRNNTIESKRNSLIENVIKD